MRRMLLPCVLALATACSSDPSPFVPEDVTRTDAGLPPLDGSTDRPTVDRTQPEVLDLTDVTVEDDAPTTDVPCTPMLAGTVRFGDEGGLVASTEQFTLTAPLAFRAVRRSAGSVGMLIAMCETAVPGCNTADMVDVGEVNAALAPRDVQAIFGTARGMPGMQIVLGYDSRPADGTVFAIDLDGARVLVGEPCRVGMMTGCLAIPVGVQRLVDVLRALRDQELQRSACMTFRMR